MGSFATSVVFAVYIPASRKQHIFKKKYKICYLIFFQHWTCLSVFFLYFLFYFLISNCWWGTLLM